MYEAINYRGDIYFALLHMGVIFWFGILQDIDLGALGCCLDLTQHARKTKTSSRMVQDFQSGSLLRSMR
jgi:hypothetical protein